MNAHHLYTGCTVFTYSLNAIVCLTNVAYNSKEYTDNTATYCYTIVLCSSRRSDSNACRQASVRLAYLQ